ncbi:MAG: 50S ribosomal protein L23 [Candidatus Paceibacterota bacterium]
MGLFNKKDSAVAEEKKEVSVKETKKAKAVTSKKEDKEISFDSGAVIRNPRITEKAAYASDKNVYTFDIAPRASKLEIVKAIKSIYKVTPIKVNVGCP